MTQSDVPFYLRDLIRRFWYTIEDCNRTLRAAKTQRRFKISIGRPRFIGWEYKSVVEGDAFLTSKVQELNWGGCGWELLTAELPVLVCRDLGQIIITPGNPQTLGCGIRCGKTPFLWSHIPNASNSFHVSVRQPSICSTMFLEVFPNRRVVYGECTHDGDCPKTLQRLIKWGIQPAENADLPDDGAVIFGLPKYYT